MSLLSPSTSSLPPRPRLVLRLGFAGRKELTDPEQRIVVDSLDQVMQTLAKRLSSIAPGTPVEAGKEPPVSAYFSKQCPLPRLVTGLCEGGDAVAAEALTKVSVSPDAGASCPLGTPCIETELAAVLPFDVETYRASRPADACSQQMKTAVNCPDSARFRRCAQHSSFQRFSFLHFSFAQIPLYPRRRSGHLLFQRPFPPKQMASACAGCLLDVIAVIRHTGFFRPKRRKPVSFDNSAIGLRD